MMNLTATKNVSHRAARKATRLSVALLVAAVFSTTLIGGCGSGGGTGGGGTGGGATGDEPTPSPTPGRGTPGSVVSPPGSPVSANDASKDARGMTGANAAAMPTPVATAAKGVIAPKDAKYTIVCASFAGPAHVQQARVSKDNLVNATGHKEFYVVHDEAQSTIYYGYYRERERSENAAEAGRASKDMEYVRSLTDGEGRRLFSKSLIVPLPMPDPLAPAAFDLTRLDTDKPADDPERRYWSLAIADYTGDVQIEGKGRKQLAVESVIEARKMGYEAYYYNGPNTSTVCIGAWPRRAVREQEAVEAATNGDNGEELLVSNAPIPKALSDRIAQSGRAVKVMQPKVEIDDPTLLAMQEKFPEYSLNGVPEVNKITDPVTGKVTRRPKQSFLVEIPKAQRASLLSGDRTGGGADGDSTTSNTAGNGPSENGASGSGPALPAAPTGSGGRLRSLTP